MPLNRFFPVQAKSSLDKSKAVLLEIERQQEELLEKKADAVNRVRLAKEAVLRAGKESDQRTLTLTPNLTLNLLG